MIISYRKFLPLLWDLVRAEWPIAFTILFLNLVAAFLEGSALALLALALRQLSYRQETLFLLFVFCGVGAQIVKSAFQFGATALMATLEAKVHARTYSRIFSRILHLPFEKVSRYRLGDLTDYLSQANHLSDIFLQTNLLIRNLLMVVAYGLLLCWLSLPMTLVALVGYAAVSGLLRRIVRVVSEHSSQLTRSVTELSRKTAEHLQGIRLLHTFARQEQAIAEVNSLMQRGVSSRCRATAWGAAIEPVMEILTVLGAALLLSLGSLLLGQGGADRLPRLLALLVALYRMTPRLGGIHASLTVLAARLPNLQRIAEILQEPDRPAPSSPCFPFSGLKSEVAFQNVTLRYLRGEAAAVEDLSFLLLRGSFTALVGISGAGKSTVADLLLKLYDPTAGRIEVDGVDLKEIDAAAWRNRLGVVSQEPFLFHATLGENIAYGKPGVSQQEIEAAARAAHAHGFISQLAQGYDTWVGDRGYRLSGGQRQRIALARALIRRPDLLILDEATSALDSESERLIQQALDEQRGACTLLVIAHRLSTVRRADRILVLDGGRLAEQGTHPELLDRNGIYARFSRLQSEEIPEISGAAR